MTCCAHPISPRLCRGRALDVRIDFITLSRTYVPSSVVAMSWTPPFPFVQWSKRQKEVRILEKRRLEESLEAAQEFARESEERIKMLAEERRTWDAYELNSRNHARMIEQVPQVDKYHAHAT